MPTKPRPSPSAWGERHGGDGLTIGFNDLSDLFHIFFFLPMHGEEGQRWEHHQQHHRRVRGVSGPTAGQEGAELRGIHVILLQFRQNTVLHKVEKKTCFYNERSAPPFLMAAVFAMQKSASCNSPLATRTKKSPQFI